MAWLSKALEETAPGAVSEGVGTFRKHIDPDWIDAALNATGVATLRRRRLPAEQVVWLVLGMALLRNLPMHQVVASLDLALPGAGSRSVARSTISQARQRLGPEPMRWLFEHCSTKWAVEDARSHLFRGLSVWALDGTTFRVADSPENRKRFGLASGGDRGLSGYPLVRLVALAAARSHLILSAAFGSYADGEHTYAQAMWGKIPEDSITLVDRNFLAAKILCAIEQGRNRHWLLRSKSNTQWQIKKAFSRNDLLVELEVSRTARRQDPSLPEVIEARAIGYQTARNKPKQWLLTSLKDPHRYPPNELIALYHERWEIEVTYDEVKTHLLEREETIRSRSDSGVEQELWGILLSYNLIRLEMTRMAEEVGMPPLRISFVTAVHFIRHEWYVGSFCQTPGTFPQRLRRMREEILHACVLPPRRSDRRYPRAVKVKMSSYAKKRSKSPAVHSK